MKTDIIYRFVCSAVRLFVRRPLFAGLDKLVPGRPAMVAANHEGAWGPVVTRVWLPTPTAPWVNGAITRRGECRRFLSDFFFMEQAHMPGWLAKPLAVIIEPLLLRLLRAGNAVPVYFNGAKAAITFKASLERLAAGQILIVFPDSESTLQNRYVPDFNKGYLYTARLYWQKSGERLLIYPMCLSSRLNMISLGEPVEFSPENAFDTECNRVNRKLLEYIRGKY